ncbi:MAG TPA: hypothetical protein VF593_11250 [Chthoniobacteraceae bacterium]
MMLLTALVATALAKADTTEFAKSLDLEITSATFGTPVGALRAAEKLPAEPSMFRRDPSIEWFRGEASTTYAAKFPARKIHYGFKKDRLVAIQIDCDGYETLARKDLDRIWAAFQKLRSGDSLEHSDKHLKVRFEPFCHPGENLWASIIITPAP